MAKIEYSMEDRARALELYLDGLPFPQVGEATGISETQLKRWSDQDEKIDGKDWPEKRKELRQALSEIKRNKIIVRQKLWAELVNKLDPQMLYAAARLEPKEPTGGRQDEVATPDLDRPALFLEDLDFIANILKEKDPEGLKILARNFDLIVTEFKRKHEKAA